MTWKKKSKQKNTLFFIENSIIVFLFSFKGIRTLAYKKELEIPKNDWGIETVPSMSSNLRIFFKYKKTLWSRTWTKFSEQKKSGTLTVNGDQTKKL